MQQQTWRDLLTQILSDAQEKQRIAQQIQVKPVTLYRWAKGISHPRPRKYPSAPGESFHLSRFNPFSSSRKPISQSWQVSKHPQPISRRGYPPHSTLRSSQPLRPLQKSFIRHLIYPLILEHAIKFLDPYQQGIALSLARCVPPREGAKVRSVQEVCGRGTLPFCRDLSEEKGFLGAESLAGFAVATAHRVVLQDRSEPCRVLSSAVERA